MLGSEIDMNPCSLACLLLSNRDSGELSADYSVAGRPR